MSEKMSVYDIIQAQLINRLQEAMEQGQKFHWVKPWNGGADYPCNYSSPEKPFHAFINQLLLEPGEYLTFTQIKELHEENPEVKIKKGAKAQRVFQSFPIFKNKNGEKILDVNGDPVVERFVFKYIREYHISDIEGVFSHFQTEIYRHTATNNTELADRVIENYCRGTNLDFQIKEGSNCAFYRSGERDGKDIAEVSLPDKKQFLNLYEYYSTVFHELGHSTKRLTEQEKFSYAQEELVAEVTAATMCVHLHISDGDTQQNSAAYLHSWMERLKGEKPLGIVIACNEAKKACDTILQYSPQLLKELNNKEKQEEMPGMTDEADSKRKEETVKTQNKVRTPKRRSR